MTDPFKQAQENLGNKTLTDAGWTQDSSGFFHDPSNPNVSYQWTGSGYETVPDVPAPSSSNPANNPFQPPPALLGDWNQQNPGWGEIAGSTAMSVLMDPNTLKSDDLYQNRFQPLFNGLYGNIQGTRNVAMGALSQPNYAEQAYGQYQQYAPTDLAANMDPYYDEQRRILNEQMENAFAGRGMSGSTYEMDALGQGLVGLGAEQARAEAQYGLDRQAALTNYAMGLSQAGQGADRTGLAARELALTGLNQADQTGLAGLLGEGKMVGDIDQTTLDAISTFVASGNTAQLLRDSRINSMFGNISSAYNGLSADNKSTIDGMLQQDQDLLLATITGDLQGVYEALQSGRYDDAQVQAFLGLIAGGVGSVGMGLGSQGFNVVG